ncbi:MAG: hypothetical protein A2139_02550 [Desulfobacca sp. RBG_16_60_12]|nr:MAG: hypothetical protein A2139_02550 [Desulfobacca sp. RBG_16_60_12]
MALPPGVLRTTTIGWGLMFHSLTEGWGPLEALQPCQNIELNIHIIKHESNKLLLLIPWKFNEIYVVVLNLQFFIN